MPVSLSGKGDARRDDENPRPRPDNIPKLRPAFRDGGSVTAANSSSISDGAAALALMRKASEKRGAVAPRADGRARDSCRRPERFSDRPDWRD